MTTTELISEIRGRLPQLELLENEPMSRHCSFRIGGPVRAIAIPASVSELSRLLAILNEHGQRPLVLGNGTNLLITDKPLDRIAIKLGQKLSNIEILPDNRVYAQAGVTLARLASACAENSLTGMEFAHGIPGALGGAVSMNAGAYGGEMKDIVTRVDYLDAAGNPGEKSGEALDFGYRHSAFSDTDMIVTGCELKLSRGDKEAIKARMRELAEKRKASQPLEMSSAGSTFKRPVGGYAAALIEQSGLKGYTLGGAQVSDKHSGFVVNKGDASCEDVLALIEYIRKTVLDKTGITLEPEVKIIE